ncbi:bone morphogenetic protein 1-like [Schistocerca piceifrons]|uniref:bone morphogenetic protein 1-like n=1 Tax=Schistocerca piceifrons TaxID=274613 RepID=UPI001F5FECB3|nr:bone morphogenetic protein 1-like [Schistocerca piceifrons]
MGADSLMVLQGRSERPAMAAGGVRLCRCLCVWLCLCICVWLWGLQGSAAPLGDPEQAGFFEGDIILQPSQVASVLRGRQERNLVADDSQLWPNATLYYEVSSEFTAAQRKALEAAIADLQKETCVRFRRRTTQRTYLLLRNAGRGCASPVGYMAGAGAMSVYLRQPGCARRGTVQHELLHTLGFWHEHTRADRDRHVTVHWERIQPGREFNFKKRPASQTRTLGLPYDYGSVMHYRARAFSRDGSSLTLEPRDPAAVAVMGQRERFSRGDVAKLNRLYRCPPPFYLGDDLLQPAAAAPSNSTASNSSVTQVVPPTSTVASTSSQPSDKKGSAHNNIDTYGPPLQAVGNEISSSSSHSLEKDDEERRDRQWRFEETTKKSSVE